jgi:hypothetical protein
VSFHRVKLCCDIIESESDAVKIVVICFMCDSYFTVTVELSEIKAWKSRQIKCYLHESFFARRRNHIKGLFALFLMVLKTPAQMTFGFVLMLYDCWIRW